MLTKEKTAKQENELILQKKDLKLQIARTTQRKPT